jgi:lysozyme
MESPLITSPRGLALIRSFENFAPKAYRCPAGKWTIGYGHVIRANEAWLMTATLTQAQAEQLLRDDLRPVETYLSRVLPDWARTHHFDALASLVFNIGATAFDGSTLLARLKSGNRTAAQAEFVKWVFAAGKRLRGLEIRRACEQLMFAGCTDNTIETERRRLSLIK